VAPTVSYYYSPYLAYSYYSFNYYATQATRTEAPTAAVVTEATDDASRFSVHDDFINNIPLPEAMDNGKIFYFALDAAKRLSEKPLTGDLYVPTKAFQVVNDVLAQNGTYNFDTLCGPAGGPSGCALFAFRVSGGDDRSISDFYFQPGASIAYTNTIYNAKTLKSLAELTPTNLTQVSPLICFDYHV
jgi:hypothetical protein